MYRFKQDKLSKKTVEKMPVLLISKEGERKVKKALKSMVVILTFCLSLTSLYARTGNQITEAAFANLLNTIQKVGSKTQTGSESPLTREKAACMIVDFLGYTAIAKDMAQNTSFTDVSSSKGEIEVVSELGIMNGVGNHCFQPKAYVTLESAQAIVDKVKNKLQVTSTWNHACYAISSSSQMDWIKDYQAVSFGWAEVLKTQNGFKVSESEGNLKVPSGFEKPIDLAKANGVETYLMIYFEDQGGEAQSLLTSPTARSTLITEILSLTNGITKDGVTRGFDGVTIDFEGFKESSLRANYVSFLQELKTALKAQNKKLNVALQPTTYYKGYDYAGIGIIADHVILMAHDYGARSLSLSQQQAGMTTTPLTPIDDVFAALLEAKKSIKDSNKIALQFSFASLQWQKQNGTVLNSNAYTPSYDKIQTRLQTIGTNVHFDDYYQCTYATYENNGITNVIWYEDAKSIQTKMELAKLLGIHSFSYWRLGMLPNEVRNLK